jgi:hypothetical protein
MSGIFVAIVLASALSSQPFVTGVSSETPVLIDGNWIYPEDQMFILTVDSLGVLINGYVYYKTPPKPRPPVPPDREKDPVTRAARSAHAAAQEVVDNGGSALEAKDTMTARLNSHAGTIFKDVKPHGEWGFEIYTYDFETPFYISSPRHPRPEPVEPPSPLERAESAYLTLRSFLEHGFFVILFTRHRSTRTFGSDRAGEAIAIIRDIQNNPAAYLEDGEFPHMTVIGDIKFSRDEMRILADPPPLEVRQP